MSVAWSSANSDGKGGSHKGRELPPSLGDSSCLKAPVNRVLASRGSPPGTRTQGAGRRSLACAQRADWDAGSQGWADTLGVSAAPAPGTQLGDHLRISLGPVSYKLTLEVHSDGRFGATELMILFKQVTPAQQYRPLLKVFLPLTQRALCGDF